MGNYRIGVVGATGMVGQEIIRLLLQRRFPVASIRFFASKRSVGRKLNFGQERIQVEEAHDASFQGLQLVFFSARGSISSSLVPRALQEGAVVIDNSSTFRLQDGVPLIAVGVNEELLRDSGPLIANPNCSTIQMTVAVEPLYAAVGIERILVDTYQSVSGTGYAAVEELKNQSLALLTGAAIKREVYPHRIAFNLLPHIDVFQENGYTREELKLVEETKKIFQDPSLRISGTAVRVPVFTGHGEAISLVLKKGLSRERARTLLMKSPHIRVVDDPERNRYPLPTDTEKEEAVLVGRIREDLSHERGLLLWVVANNLWKGAALNAVQIGEKLINSGCLRSDG